MYYTHQGWLFEDQTHLVLDDEIDELSGPTPSALPPETRPTAFQRLSILPLFALPFRTAGHTHGVPDRTILLRHVQTRAR